MSENYSIFLKKITDQRFQIRLLYSQLQKQKKINQTFYLSNVYLYRTALLFICVSIFEFILIQIF